MPKLPISAIAATLAALMAWGPNAAYAEAQPIDWRTLRPAEQRGMLIGQSTDDETLEMGRTLKRRFDGETVAISGFILPIDREGDLVYEFILVPLAGGCSHTFSPPANQLVHVIPAEPVTISRNYEPATITGRMKVGLEKTQAYVVDGARVLESGYFVGRADVTKLAAAGAAKTFVGQNPWAALTK